MQFNLKLMSVLFLLLVLLSTAFAACDIQVDSLDVTLKDSGSYANSITATQDADIDIKMTFRVSDYSGTTCPADINVKADIYKYDAINSRWVFVESKNESRALSENNYTVTWSNQFNTGHSSNYTRFKVEAFVLNGSTELDDDTANVEVSNDSCNGITINSSTINASENDSTTETFSLENNTDETFRIISMDYSTSSSLINNVDFDYADEYVYSDSDEDFDVTVETDSVSSDTTVTVSLSVAGYLGNKYCSATDIGRESVSVRIEDDSSGSGSDFSSDCDDIDIQTRLTEFEEGTAQKLIFGVKNNSTKRFEILGVEASSSSFNLSKYFNEKYIFSGQIGDLILNAVLPNVTSDRNFSGLVKVRGVFSDGKSCSFSQIDSKTFNVNVINSESKFVGPNCSGFNISVPESVTVENNGSFNFTITNSTNQTANIVVEGSIDVTPTVIVLPKNSSLSKAMNVQLNSQTGFVKFDPSVDGCFIGSKTVQLINTATGDLSEASMDLTMNRDNNLSVITLNVLIQNSSNKNFTGVLNIDSPNGWPSVQKTVTVVPGSNNFVEKLGSSGNFKEGTIKVSFSADKKTISDSIETSEQNNSAFAGLFAFGGSLNALGIILIIILVIVIIVGVIETSPSTRTTKGQEWVNQKN